MGSENVHNYIGIDESPIDIYRKTMSLPDNLMPKFFMRGTCSPEAESASILEMLAKRTFHLLKVF